MGASAINTRSLAPFAIYLLVSLRSSWGLDMIIIIVDDDDEAIMDIRRQ
jgi:hypothetical protein